MAKRAAPRIRINEAYDEADEPRVRVHRRQTETALSQHKSSSSGHIHWTIQCFQRLNGESFDDAMSVRVEAPTEDEALLRAMQIVDRRYYRTANAEEVCSKDPNLKQ